MKRKECPICGELLVEPVGPESSPILLVGAYPGWEEVRTGIPWTGPAGDVFKEELGRAGINYRDCRVTNLWLHKEVDPKHDRYEQEFDYHFKRLIQETFGKRGVLLMGRQPVALLLEESITDVEGLNIVPRIFPSSVEVCVISQNPASILTPGAVVGNVRHAIERFAELTKEWR